MLAILIRSAILYSTVVVFMRLMGKRQISQMQPFELVISIMVADLVTGPMEDMGVPLIEGIIPLIALLVLHNLMDFLCQKSKWMRRIICGSPSVLIQNGALNEQELKKLSINMSDLMEYLRNKGYGNIEEIMYCILETNGSVSILPMASARPATTKEARVKAEDPCLRYTVIYDGRVDRENLRLLSIDGDLLKQNLKLWGFENIKNIYVAMVDTKDGVFLQEKTTGKVYKGMLDRRNV